MHGEFLFLSVLFLCFIDESCKLSCAGVVSKRLGLLYRSGRSPYQVKIKNPTAPAVTHEAEEDWGL
jgi:ATP-dependent DNA ligase